MDYFWIIYLGILFSLFVFMLFFYIYMLRNSRMKLKKKLSQTSSNNIFSKKKTYNSKITDIYIKFHRHIEYETLPSDKDWKDIEVPVSESYPSFSSTLYSAYHLSILEYRTCLLLKAGFTPKEISYLLCKSKEAISSIRRRLCGKIIVAERPSAKIFDKYIASI